MKKKILAISLAVIFTALAVASYMWYRAALKKVAAAEEAYLMALKIEQSKPKHRVKAVSLGQEEAPVSTVELVKN